MALGNINHDFYLYLENKISVFKDTGNMRATVLVILCQTIKYEYQTKDVTLHSTQPSLLVV